jgi:hypothetical protein
MLKLAVPILIVLSAVLSRSPAAAGAAAGALGDAPHGLPDGVAPLTGEAARHVERMLKETEKLRGLTAQHPVLAGEVDEKDLPARISESIREDLPPERLHAAGLALQAFGLLPEGFDLARYLPGLLAGQVLGYYDPKHGYLGVVRREHDAHSALDDDMVLVHELTHALQDQAFDLESFEEDDPLSDEAAARTALVEGDAAEVMFDFMTRQPAAPAPDRDPDSARDRDFEAAPAWVRASLEFTYVDGMRFCAEVRKAGGQALLDRAFRDDPPLSSEQILHPEKWTGERDDPVLLSWPDLAAALPGARELAQGQLGELGIRVLLAGTGGGETGAERAAAGWGGDRFAVYEKDGRRLLAWLTAWDTAADARELESALHRLDGKWKARRVAPRRVVVLHGPWKRKEARAVVAALAAVPSEAVERGDVGERR